MSRVAPEEASKEVLVIHHIYFMLSSLICLHRAADGGEKGAVHHEVGPSSNAGAT